MVSKKAMMRRLVKLLVLLPLSSTAFHPTSFGLSSHSIQKRESSRLLLLSSIVPAELALTLAVDATAASVTAFCVAPLIAAFDEAITRSASGEENLWSALGKCLTNIVTQPRAFFRSAAFRWMWMVYAATYVAANSLKTVEKAVGLQFGFASTLAVTLVNMSCGIAKDSAYSKLFGCDEEEGCKVTPTIAYITWFIRDVTAFTFILTLPTVVASLLNIPLDLAKFTTPIFAQYVTTILHLLGFNMCNNPDGTFIGWLKAIRPTYFSTVAARQMRIIPPYSIGGVLNGKLLTLAPMALKLVTSK